MHRAVYAFAPSLTAVVCLCACVRVCVCRTDYISVAHLKQLKQIRRKIKVCLAHHMAPLLRSSTSSAPVLLYYLSSRARKPLCFVAVSIVQNKLSAKYSRMRRKEYISTIETDNDKLNEQVRHLQLRVSELQRENAALRSRPQPQRKTRPPTASAQPTSAGTGSTSSSLSAGTKLVSKHNACAFLVVALALSSVTHDATSVVLGNATKPTVRGSLVFGW